MNFGPRSFFGKERLGARKLSPSPTASIEPSRKRRKTHKVKEEARANGDDAAEAEVAAVAKALQPPLPALT